MAEEKLRDSPLEEAFDKACTALNEAGAKYALIGGFAVACHGLPRATQDVDFLISVPRLSLPSVLERFHQNGFSFDLLEVLRELGSDHLSSVRYRGIRVDLLDAILPIFSQAVEHASEHAIRGRPVRVVSPEDLIVLKLLASRPGDLEDIRGILAAKRGVLDVDALRASVARVCAEGQRLELEELLKMTSR